ncbi:hypothetical protein Tco_1246182 [Tanacetum coccineum]
MPTAMAGCHSAKAYGASSDVVGAENFWAVTMARSHGSAVPLPLSDAKRDLLAFETPVWRRNVNHHLGISSSGINGCISHTYSISETYHNMSTNDKRPTCDIKTDHVIPNEAADASSEVEITSDMPVIKNVVKRKQDNPDKGSESNSELFLDQLGLDLTGTIIVMLGRMWDVSSVTGRYLSTDFVVSDAKVTLKCYTPFCCVFLKPNFVAGEHDSLLCKSERIL